MKYRELGNTGLKVSEIGFGGWAIGGDLHANSYGPTDDKTSFQALQRAFDLGLNFFDTADVYGRGHSEELIGRLAKGKRDRVIIATKVGADFYRGIGFQSFDRGYVQFALEKSLARLQTDYIDLYQLHNPPLRLLKNPALYDVMRDLKKEGKIRSWGVSIFDPTEGLLALKFGKPDALQMAYNAFNARAAEELFASAGSAGCAVVVREALGSGYLAGRITSDTIFASTDFRSNLRRDFVLAKIEAANKLRFLIKENRTLAQSCLQYALARPEVSVVLAGMKTPEQVEENASASDTPMLVQSELEAIAELQEHAFNL